MRKPVLLITGASGEIGQGLIDHFAAAGTHQIVTLDLSPIHERQRSVVSACLEGDILDKHLLQQMVSQYEVHEIYHLAALLSTRAEYSPEHAHAVNVEGTLNLLQLAHEQSRWHGSTVRFLFPSSIAVYGLPDRATKERAGRIPETSFTLPTTMYGCNKLYCEHLGRYYTQHFRQLAAEAPPSGVDFRALRFPGLISAISVPSGGTSDYAPEMIHAAARDEEYACFVDSGAALPFMAMPDAIRALVQLAGAPAARLTQRVYNVGAFSLTAGQIRTRVLSAFPRARIRFEPHMARARIVDSWPMDVDDSPARRDWGWEPEYGADRAFDEYLVPTIARFYRGKSRRES
ncbi:MAG: NAD-dependent epimerase/dehydratase family protein [Planctomycetota bacterium]